MADFQEAYKQGLAAHQDVLRAKAEVDAVVQEFSDQLKRASGGAISKVEIHKRYLKIQLPVSPPLTEAFLPSGRTHQVLVAFGEHEGDGRAPEQELCELKMAAQGYPVYVVFCGTDIECLDRDGFELALAELLKHPSTGSKLAQLIDRKTAFAPGSSTA